MQRFHDTPTQNAATTPVYDSETVREVLARAAQIEQQAQTDAPMTAEQIETLGRELGMSPESVRRALGEKTTTQYAPVQTRTATEPVATQARMKSALLPLFWLAFLCFPVANLTLVIDRNWQDVSLMSNYFVVVVALVVTAFFLFRLGWIIRQQRAALFAATYAPVVTFLTLLAPTMAEGRSMWHLAPFLGSLFTSVLAVFVCGFGMTVGAWWDKLPKDADR